MPDLSWKRPESLSFPIIWSRFNGKKQMSNGQIPKFRIQDITEDLEDAVVEHMLSSFFKEEPLSACLSIREEAESVEDIRKLYRETLKHRISLVALLDDDGDDGSENPTIAGVHFLVIQSKNEKDFDSSKFQGKRMKKMFDALQYICEGINLYEKYGVERTLAEKGLSVAPEFRGQGIGLELLKAKIEVGKAIDIKVAPMVCTAVESQILAERTGYELIKELPYDECVVDGNTPFRIPNIRSMKYYVAKF